MFIGLAITPMSGADNIGKKGDYIPIEVSICQNYKTMATETIKLTKDNLKALDILLQTLQSVKSEDEIKEKITEFFTSYDGSKLGGIFNFEWLENLPGRPIFSFGKGHKYLTRYHGRLQIKKLFSTWSYPNGVGTTVIWGNGITAPPTQILLKRQFGFMVGFVGLYVHIPPLISGMSSRTLFIGSSFFAWGAAI